MFNCEFDFVIPIGQRGIFFEMQIQVQGIEDVSLSFNMTKGEIYLLKYSFIQVFDARFIHASVSNCFRSSG
jgi:hypothetical protein